MENAFLSQSVFNNGRKFFVDDENLEYTLPLTQFIFAHYKLSPSA